MDFDDDNLLSPTLPSMSAPALQRDPPGFSGDQDWDMFTNEGTATEDAESDDKGTVKRKSRNLSEKKRRDQFNMLINEMALIVSTDKRRMNKSTVLKSAISFLQAHKDITTQSSKCEIQGDWKPSFLLNIEFTQLVLEASDSFILVFTADGTILYVSDSVTPLLGHPQSRLVNTSIYDIAHPSLRSSLQSCMEAHNRSENSIYESEGRDVFDSHLKRCPLYPNEPVYFEPVTISGYFKSLSTDAENFPKPEKNENNLSKCFMCTVKVHTPPLIREMTMVDESKCEFTSRLSLEWNFIFLDQRAQSIIGYQPLEVLGNSCYEYYHTDDIQSVANGYENLIKKGKGTSCVYRFLSKGQQWIWMETQYYITYHQWNARPEFIVCTNTVINYQEAREMHTQQQSISDGGGRGLNTGFVEPSSQSIRETPNDAGSACIPENALNIFPDSRSQTQDLNYLHRGNNVIKINQQQPITLQQDGRQQTFINSSDRSVESVFVAPWSVQGNIQMNAMNNRNTMTPGRNLEIPPSYTPIPPLPNIDTPNSIIVPQVMMPSSHSQIQEELQEKSELLQIRIKEQQQELKKLTDQITWSQTKVFPVTPQQSLGDDLIFESSAGMTNISNDAHLVSSVGCPVYTRSNLSLPEAVSTLSTQVQQNRPESMITETQVDVQSDPFQRFQTHEYYSDYVTELSN